MAKLLDLLRLLGLIVDLKERIKKVARKLFLASTGFVFLSAALSFLNQDLIGLFFAGLAAGSILTVYGFFNALLGWLSKFESSLTTTIDRLEKEVGSLDESK